MSKSRPAAPIFTSPSGRYLDWPAVIAAARRIPDTWFPVYWDCPASRAEVVQRQRGHDLRDLVGGRLEAQARNRYTDDDGHERCDLFVRWNTSTSTSTSGKVPETEGDPS